MNAETIFISVLIVGLVLGYFVLMYFFPEWVGISGDKTKAIQKEHLAPKTSEEDLNKK